MAETQGQLLGDQVLECTVFLGRPKDTGYREVFVSVVTERGHRQARVMVADWVRPDRVLGVVAGIVDLIESGRAYTWQMRYHLQAAIMEAEGAPF